MELAIIIFHSRLAEIKAENYKSSLRHHQARECEPPYVPRGAFPGDDICVTEDENHEVIKDNANSHSNLKHFLFFNGEDIVSN